MLNKKPIKENNILLLDDSSRNSSDIVPFCVDYRTGDSITSYPNFNHKKDDYLSKKVIPKNNSEESPKIHIVKNDQNNTARHYNKPKHANRHKTKRPAIPKAVLSLMLCIVGTIILVNSVSVETFDAVYEENYNIFLLPLVLNDPEPFNSIDELDTNKILSASIWHTVLSQDNRYYTNFDELGRVIIPIEDVAKSASILFGSNYSMPIQNPSTSTFFELDPNGKNYLVKPISNHETYIPTVLSKSIANNEIILNVGYSKPDDPFWSINEHSTSPNPEKTMNYILSKDNTTGRMYIKSIQKPTEQWNVFL